MRRLIMLGLLLGCLPVYATPGVMNYQAKLTNTGGSPITTPVNVTFTFWDAVSGGNQLGDGYSDTDLVTPDSNGVASTDIGDDPGNPIPASVFASDSVWLNVNVGGNNITPRTRVTSSAFALNALSLFGPAYVIVDVTANPTVNGSNLAAAYSRAKSLTPHGQPISANNRATVMVPPGQYDMGTTWVLLDAEFVDLVGMSTARDDQHIFGASSGTGTGVLRQTANNVRIENLRVRCTLNTGPVNNTATDPAAYFPDPGLGNTVIRNCRFEADADDNHAWSMRVAISYPGTYEDCSAATAAFGGSGGLANGKFTNCSGGGSAFGGFGGTASGTFINCTGDFGAFGGNGGSARGTFSNCISGDLSFGGNGTAPGGHFNNCGGTDGSFSASGIPFPIYTNCTLNGNPFLTSTNGNITAPVTLDTAINGSSLITAYTYAKALKPNGQDLSTTNRATLLIPPGSYNLQNTQLTLNADFVDINGISSSRDDQYIFGTANGIGTGVIAQLAADVRLENLRVRCTRSAGSLVSDSSDPAAYFPVLGTAQTTIRNCTFEADDVNALSMRRSVTYAGTYENCSAGLMAFGGGGGAASGKFTACTGSNGAFAGFFGSGNNGGAATGVFTNCTAGPGSFGGCSGSVTGGNGGAASGTFSNCTAGAGSFAGYSGVIGAPGSGVGGTFLYCNGGAFSFTTIGAPLTLYCVKAGVSYP